MRSRPVGVQPISLLFVAISLRATRGACNPNLQVVITHVLHVRSQHSFGLPLRINGMHKTQFDLAHLGPSITRNLFTRFDLSRETYAKHSIGALFWTFNHCPLTLGARDFSSAVSGLCQVFGFACSWLRPTAEDVSAFGQHRKFPPHARKIFGTQGIVPCTP